MAEGVSTVVCVFLLAVTSLGDPTMKSVRHNPADGSLHVQTDTPRPAASDGQVLIKVKGAGLNRLDLLQAKGLYPPPPGESGILGVEVSGTVEQLTPLAEAGSGLKLGDEVAALVGGGGYAEYCVAPYQTVVRVPEGVSLIEAAGLPEVFLTAYQALVWNGKLKDGETVLIHAGASGVGLAAIQLCKRLYKDTKVIVTVGSNGKFEKCREFGADVAINYKTQDFAAEVLAATNDTGADVILDFVGASYLEKHARCIALEGRIVHLGFLGGAVIQSPFNLGPFLRKRVTQVYSTLRSRPIEYKAALTKELSERVLPLFAAGALRVPVDSTFPLAEATQAHQRMTENKNVGKILLTVS